MHCSAISTTQFFPRSKQQGRYLSYIYHVHSMHCRALWSPSAADLPQLQHAPCPVNRTFFLLLKEAWVSLSTAYLSLSTAYSETMEAERMSVAMLTAQAGTIHLRAINHSLQVYWESIHKLNSRSCKLPELLLEWFKIIKSNFYCNVLKGLTPHVSQEIEKICTVCSLKFIFSSHEQTDQADYTAILLRERTE